MLKNENFLKIYSKAESILLINYLSSEGTPFLILTDFKGEKNFVSTLEELDNEQLKYSFNSKSNIGFYSKKIIENIKINKRPIRFEAYKQSFGFVKNQILKGNSFLTNLTTETPIEINLSLLDVFRNSEAKYKIHLKNTDFSNEFVCFSPEIFVKINENGQISSFPMKGTIDASLPNAEEILLNDKKEFYEHTTIVDLIRNDLSCVAEKVWVEKFRYIERIKTHDGSELLQVSSQVSGLLSSNWKNTLGEIIFKMLPAGSISGAPKAKTIDIIDEAEKQMYELSNERGFYTGICGIFDGKTFDSGVMIRFIEQTSKGKVFKSGGGITSNSIAENEYQEMIQKIYVPIIRNNQVSKPTATQSVLS